MSGEGVVITRPKDDEKNLTDLLHERGYFVIHEPLTHIFLQHTERPALERALEKDPDACIVTSRHGVRALASLSALRDIFLICVGESTARTAQSLGYERVVSTGGSALKLIGHIAQGYDAGSRFLYVSGEHIRVDIETALAHAHMQVQRLVVYEAVAATQLSDALIQQLECQQLAAITFLSTRTAKIFTGLLDRAHVQEYTRNLHAIGLSAAVAEPLRAYPWKQIHIAPEATLASMLETVDTIFQS